MQQLQESYPDQLNVFHVITGPGETEDDFRVFYKDQLSKLLVRKLTKNLTSESQLTAEVYLCGPHGFMKMIEESITSLNLPIHKEHFFIPADLIGYDFDSLPSRGVVIQWNDKEYLVNVAGGQPILRAALHADLKLPHSCNEGQCGTCRCLLVSGEVKLRKNHVLTDEELEQSQILMCQAYPVSENVVIRTMH